MCVFFFLINEVTQLANQKLLLPILNAVGLGSAHENLRKVGFFGVFFSSTQTVRVKFVRSDCSK